jgi:WD40-like Beta Propeller Repeat
MGRRTVGPFQGASHWTTSLTAAVAIVAAGCGSATAPQPRPVTPAAATRQPGAVASPSAGVGGSVPAGRGELAVIANGHLFMAGGPTDKVRRIRVPGLPVAPAWSADHRWLAVLVRKPPPAGQPDLFQAEPTALWVVSAAGTGAQRLTPRSWNITGFAWSPRANRLAAAVSLPSAKPGGSGAVAMVTLHGGLRVLASGDVSGVAWSPDGSQIAAGVSVFTGRPSWQSRLELLNPPGGPPQAVRVSKGNVLQLAGWWPDGSGLLFWTDPQGSDSIAADGLPLDTVSLASGQPRDLAGTMLVHSSWLAFAPGGHTVAVVAGGYREIWSEHKQITICRPGGACTAVAQGSGVVSLDPSWSPDGRQLAFARASAAGPFGPHGHADFSPYWIRRWQATSRLWVASADGSGARPLTAAGPGALDPVWGSDGSLLFVRDDWLWLLPPGAPAPARVAGPLGALTGQAYYQTYYGYVPYPELIAWTLARPFATAGSS